jgi:Cu-processing system ATP-binding protein
MTDPILRVDAVEKAYGRHKAVDGVSITVAAGERVALLGHNGAGKTTLMKMILGLTQPTGGRIEVLGHAPGSYVARRKVAWLPEHVVFNRSLTAAELMATFARLKRAPVRDNLDLLARVGLKDAVHKRVGTFSKGMRQRLGLAQALIGEPELLLLDEPTTGLDPVSRQSFYDIVGELAARGVAVLLSSHVLTELEARTDRVIIMRAGKLVASDRLAELRGQVGLPVRIRLAVRPDAASSVAAELGGERVNGHGVELLCRPEDKMALLGRIAGFGRMVEDIDISPPSLDEIYRRLGGERPQ